MLGGQSQAQLGVGLGVGTSTVGGGVFGNQPRLGVGVAGGGGLFSSTSTQNKLGGGLVGTGGGLFGQQSTSQASGLFSGNTGGGGILFNQTGAGTQLGTGLGMQPQVSAMFMVLCVCGSGGKDDIPLAGIFLPPLPSSPPSFADQESNKLLLVQDQDLSVIHFWSSTFF